MLFHYTPPSTGSSARFSRRPALAKRWGAATVEMAFVAPIFVVLLFGTIELSRGMMVANMLTSIAREGARVATLPNSSNADIAAAVNKSLDGVGIPKAEAIITIKANGAEVDAATAKTGDVMVVSVAVPARSVTWLPMRLFLDGDAHLSGISAMRRE
jgi:Flp pilus assembly protein TadG